METTRRKLENLKATLQARAEREAKAKLAAERKANREYNRRYKRAQAKLRAANLRSWAQPKEPKPARPPEPAVPLTPETMQLTGQPAYEKRIIEEFKKTRWFNATVQRHRAHLDACDKQGCPELKETFFQFVSDVLGSPEAVRDDLLDIQPLEPYEPFMSYSAYQEPTKQEQKLGFYSETMGNKMR